MKSAYRINVSDEAGVAFALQETRETCELIGFEEIQARMIATIISELSTNILKYARRGQLSIEVVTENRKRGIHIKAIDKGPGIENLEESLSDHFSSSGTLGLGLPGVKRLADEFSISSELGKGTCVCVRVWRW